RAKELGKGVVMMKCGVSPAGARAAATHTGAMAGGGRVWREVADQAYVMRVDSLVDLVDVCAAWTSQPPSIPPRSAAMLSVSGGMGVICADLFAENDVEVATPDTGTVDALGRLLG